MYFKHNGMSSIKKIILIFAFIKTNFFSKEVTRFQEYRSVILR